MHLRHKLSTVLLSQPDYGLADLRGDVLGGVTAASVVLPVAMGYGVISGLGPVSGVYGAIAVGLFAAVLGGTRGMISGPNLFVTISMGVVVSEYATSIAEAATAGILAGLILIAFGLLGFGRYASYIPYSLLSGFFTASGTLIIMSQTFAALGAASVRGGTMDLIKAWPEAVANTDFHALGLTVFCVALGVLWRGRLLRLSPAPFVVLIAGTLVGAQWLQGTATIEKIPSGLPTLQLSAISLEFLLRVLQPAFIMALLGAVASLIVALRLDAITGSQHQPNRELVGLGIGNIAAGLIGGSPSAQNVSSFVNAYSGGRTPVAGITVSLLLLAVMLFLGPIAERIPLAVLAGILIVNGWFLIDWRFITRIHRSPRSYTIVMLLTFFLVVFVDLASGVVIGLVVAGFVGGRRLEDLEVGELVSVPLLDRAVLEDGDLDDDADLFQARTGLVLFPSRVTVASARQVSRIVRPDISSSQQIVVFDMSRTLYVDDSAAVIIGELIQIVMAQQLKTFIISGLKGDVGRTLDAMGLLDQVPKENIAADMEEAKRIIRPMLRAQ